MNSFTIFLAVIAAFFAFAILINKIKGVKAQYLDTFRPEAGEEIRLHETGADFHLVTRLGQARVMSFARLRRTEILVTTTRMVIGQKVLFGKRYIITHMIYLDTAPEVVKDLDKLTGGLYAKGYTIYLAKRNQFTSDLDGKKAYLKCIPESTPSATNIEHLRIYVDAPEKLLAAIAGNNRPGQ